MRPTPLHMPETRHHYLEREPAPFPVVRDYLKDAMVPRQYFNELERVLLEKVKRNPKRYSKFNQLTVEHLPKSKLDPGIFDAMRVWHYTEEDRLSPKSCLFIRNHSEHVMAATEAILCGVAALYWTTPYLITKMYSEGPDTRNQATEALLELKQLHLDNMISPVSAEFYRGNPEYAMALYHLLSFALSNDDTLLVFGIHGGIPGVPDVTDLHSLEQSISHIYGLAVTELIMPHSQLF